MEGIHPRTSDMNPRKVSMSGQQCHFAIMSIFQQLVNILRAPFGNTKIALRYIIICWRYNCQVSKYLKAQLPNWYAT